MKYSFDQDVHAEEPTTEENEVPPFKDETNLIEYLDENLKSQETLKVEIENCKREVK